MQNEKMKKKIQFCQVWCRSKSLAIKIKKSIGTTRLNPTVQQKWANAIYETEKRKQLSSKVVSLASSQNAY